MGSSELWSAQAACAVAHAVPPQGSQDTPSAEVPQGALVPDPVGLISKTFLLGVLSSGLSQVKWCSVAEAGRSLQHQ